ncbi:hypothetical protein CH373_05885 [Leptospira perolatii]|uniref:1-aminocyclopropane-1-carboxylate deaminase n=1 Tax=Leptospira perolatii TaxID=2023191 RepID=A0A2M9ZQW5_9LEPT|nr:1-aminocyclopropane-1-carboxylate deaminase [Leptospira perolatii]PJZ68379.1 hypothetical protein CH360_16520 [Leptospira perolatii]PJZ74425.1 hypothetical protein CH373_05885 [Leptospira perolatii]
MENPLLRILPQTPTPVQKILSVGKSGIYIKREDRIFFSQGTKIRKLAGIYFGLLPGIENVRSVLLQGNIHTNAILAGALFFRWLGIPFHVVGYNRNLQLRTAASILSNRFGTVTCYPTRTDWKEAMIHASFKDGTYVIPEFFFTPKALQGLETLWSEINPSDWDFIYLDVGSGLTWLSGLENKISHLYGICLGLPKTWTIHWIRERLPVLGLSNRSIDFDRLVEPREVCEKSFHFGSQAKFWEEKTFELYKITGIYFEPIYAAKSLTVIESMIESGKIAGKILYIYQGGALMSEIGI